MLPSFFSGTILENLRWGDKDATEEECIHACRLACADEFIGKLPDGYHTYIEQGGSNVSGGQKFLVRSDPVNLPVVKHENTVGMLYARNTLRNNQLRCLWNLRRKRMADLRVRRGIDRACTVVENQDLRSQ